MLCVCVPNLSAYRTKQFISSGDFCYTVYEPTDPGRVLSQFNPINVFTTRVCKLHFTVNYLKLYFSSQTEKLRNLYT